MASDGGTWALLAWGDACYFAEAGPSATAYQLGADSVAAAPGLYLFVTSIGWLPTGVAYTQPPICTPPPCHPCTVGAECFWKSADTLRQCVLIVSD